jgi:hypothetical protein
VVTTYNRLDSSANMTFVDFTRVHIFNICVLAKTTDDSPTNLIAQISVIYFGFVLIQPFLSVVLYLSALFDRQFWFLCHVYLTFTLLNECICLDMYVSS